MTAEDEVGAPAPHALIQARFSDARPFSQPALGAIDEVNGIGGRVRDPATIPRAIMRGAPIYLNGWVWQPALAGGPLGAFVTVDGTYAAPAHLGRTRPDVADVHGNAAAESGFEAFVPSHTLSDGLHAAGIVLMHDFGTYSVGPQRIVSIVPSAPQTTIATPLTHGMRIELDALDVEGGFVSDADGGQAVRYGSAVYARGWAFDAVAGQPCAGIYAIVDEMHVIRGRYGGERPDVAAEENNPQLHYCAFEIRIDTALIGFGDHILRIGALSADGNSRGEEASRSLKIRF